MQLQPHRLNWPIISFGPINLWSMPWYPPAQPPQRPLKEAEARVISAKHQELAKLLTQRG